MGGITWATRVSCSGTGRSTLLWGRSSRRWPACGRRSSQCREWGARRIENYLTELEKVKNQLITGAFSSRQTAFGLASASCIGCAPR